MEFAEKVLQASLETVIIRVGAIDCIVLVVPSTFNAMIPYFVGRIGDDRYFISDGVPERFRTGVIAHEANCFALRACGRKGHCVAALTEEMRHVPREEHAEYLKMRLAMFEGLVRYLESRPRDEFVDEVEAARDKLRTLAG